MPIDREDALAANYAVNLIVYFGGGSAEVVPPKLIARRVSSETILMFEEPQGGNCTIRILEQPQGGPLDEDLVGVLPTEVIAKLPRLRTEASVQGISLEERIKQFIEEWLEKRYPAFMEVVRKKELEYRAQFEEALNTLLGISDKSQLSEEKQEVYQGMIDSYIERMKSFSSRFRDLAPDDLLILVTEYMLALKSAVASFIKTATGEDFDLFNPYHAGLLTYWADWAFSYARPVEISKEEAIKEATAALADREELVKNVNTIIFKGKGDPLSGEFGRVLSHFADMTVYNEYDYDRIREEISIFGQKLEEAREDIMPLVAKLGVDVNTEEGQKIVERFNLLLLSKLFEVFDKEAMDEFAEEHKNDPGLVDGVKYSRYYTFEREDIKAGYVCPIGVEDFFGGVEYQEAIGKIGQYIDDMLAINGKFQEKFGKSYDATTPQGVEKLLGWVREIEDRIQKYMEGFWAKHCIEHGEIRYYWIQISSPERAHQMALEDVLGMIESLNEFPEEEAYIEDNQFAVQEEDIPLAPFEPVVVSSFEDLL